MNKPLIYISHRKRISETPVEFSERSVNIVRGMMEEALTPFDIGNLVQGKSVFIKPNLVRPNYIFNPAVCSDPRAIIALGSILKDAGTRKIMAGDNPGVGLSFKEALKEIPGLEWWKKYHIEPFFYEDYPTVEIELPKATLFRKMKIPKAILDFEAFINLAKLKMHMHVGASLGIKNLYGLLSDEQRMTFHRQDVNRKLVEILQRFIPDLTIVEGIWALEGQAPICGNPVKDFNTIVAGINPVAVDAIASTIIGYEPYEIAITRLAHSLGLGPMDLREIEVRGSELEKVRRSLKRPVVSSVGVYDNCTVYELGVCIGCMSGLRHALDRLQYGGELATLSKNTYILGIPGRFYEPLHRWEGDLWLIGDCPEKAYGEAGNIVRVPGCPPHFGEIIQTLKKRYQ